MRDYTASDLSTVNSFIAALHYLKKKREARMNRRGMALIPWVVGMLAVWGMIFFLYYGF